MKKYINRLVLSCASIFVFTFSSAQEISSQSVNSCSSKMIQTNGSLSFTLGELLVLTQSDSTGNTLYNGFCASTTLTIVVLQEIDLTILDANIYPNPTTESIKIQFKQSYVDQVVILLTDLQGKVVFNDKYTELDGIIEIKTNTLQVGTYLLSLKAPNNQLLGAYKIIKH